MNYKLRQTLPQLMGKKAESGEMVNFGSKGSDGVCVLSKVNARINITAQESFSNVAALSQSVLLQKKQIKQRLVKPFLPVMTPIARAKGKIQPFPGLGAHTALS